MNLLTRSTDIDTASGGSLRAHRAGLDQTLESALQLSAPWPDVVSTTTWLPTAPIAVRIDRPADGLAAGAVLVLPPFGHERVVGLRTARVLAMQAARAGFVAVSPDLPGDGDSPATSAQLVVTAQPVAAAQPAATPEPFAAAWPAAVAAALAYARAMVPGRLVHAVGLRLGACLVAGLPAQPGELRVLWEPVTGRAATRRLRGLRRHSVPVPVVEDGIELASRHLSTAELRALEALTLPDTDAPDTGTPGHLVRREVDRRVANRIATTTPYAARVPQDAIREIVAGLPLGPAAPIEAVPLRATATVADGVRETLLVLGPRRVRAVLTQADVPPHDARPHDAPPTPRAVLAFTAMGSEFATGPADLWAREARRLAPYGVVSIRADRTGLGDAINPDDPYQAAPYTDAAAADCAELLAMAQTVAAGAPVIGVGVCAGPWCLLRAAEVAPPTAVLAFNQVHFAPEESYFDDQFYRRWNGTDARRDAPFEPAPAGASLVPASLVPESPTGGRWRALRRTALERWPSLAVLRHPHEARDRVGRLLARVPSGVDVTFVSGPWESRFFEAKGGTSHLVQRGGRIRLTVEPNLDHSLVSETARRLASRHLDALLSRFGAVEVAA
ncbi:MAG: hypothetical protein LCH98_18700 [Actinobacteria bacterium]|nr:hypothetical protein [Actinomycetota bacterium]